MPRGVVLSEELLKSPGCSLGKGGLGESMVAGSRYREGCM